MRRVLLFCLLLIMPAFRFAPGFSIFWMDYIAGPFSETLQAVSALPPFPLLEVGVLLTVVSLIGALLRGRIRRAAGIVAMLLAGYALLWYPAYWTAEAPIFSPTAVQLEALSQSLIEELNRSKITFPSVSDALESAVDAVSAYTAKRLPDNAVKAARYPEWMRGLGIAGLYSPWTGEAIVDGGAFPGALIFTACHELMHREGVADEGLANIAAWKACIEAGGDAAVSAKLWALRYAMPMLREADEDAWRRCVERMNASSMFAFRAMNGFSARQGRSGWLRFLGLDESTQNYEALIGWLAIDSSAFD